MDEMEVNGSGSQLKLRRTRSETRAGEIQKSEERIRSAQPDRACHKPQDSLFSWSSGFNNYEGLVNWGFLLLAIGGLRLLLENFIKYGVRVDPKQWLIALTGSQEGNGEYISLILLAYLFVPLGLCLLFEKGMASDVIGSKPGMLAQVLNLAVLLLTPIVVMQVKPRSFSIIGASVVCFNYSILFLKLWSYIQVNMWCRESINKSALRRQSVSYNRLSSAYKNGKSKNDQNAHKVVNYPDNLTVKDILYFMAAPTLCYELNFPRTTRIRKRFLLKRLLEVFIGAQIIIALIQQWIIPSVKNSLIPFSNLDILKATERLLKLAIPNHLIWLTWFYVFFHSFFNLIGEILHFADRNFYNDWWNAHDIDTFWRTWNMPVHRWAVRHLYLPIVRSGYGKTSAFLAVFSFSAFFHEYLVSVPLHTYKIWAFLGMMWQIPLSVLSRKVEKTLGPRYGNILVWTGVIMGQPLLVMMYYHDYIITNFGEAVIEDFSRL